MMICADCGFDSVSITEKTLKKGSSVREPGEAVCPSCTAHRIKMIRSLDKIPDRLDQIRANRMVRG